uniref:Ig-like domain-containing protein n=1 Tax=Chelydra serpentina TaxID=8475 RepID=A0A8C3SI40_CHESE
PKAWGKVGHEFFKPTVWVSPSRVVALGGSVTIGCGGWYRSMKFFLRKAGHPNPQVQTVVPDWTMAEFRIPSVGREAGGSYTCDYHSITEQNRSSHPSDPVEIIVAAYSRDLHSPLQVSGAAVHRSQESWLPALPAQKPGSEWTPETGLACHPLGSRALAPRGWGCSVSHAVSPGLRGNSGPLWKGVQEPVPRAAGSDPPLRPHEPSYPKPSISLRPSGEVSLGGAVTVWCRVQRRGVRFVLNKEGRHVSYMDSDGSEVVFPINNVRREDGGSYSCSYHSRSEPFAVSYPSDPVELVVRGEGPSSASPFPAPTPARPSRGISGLEGTIGGHLVQPPAQSRTNPQFLPQIPKWPPQGLNSQPWV